MHCAVHIRLRAERACGRCRFKTNVVFTIIIAIMAINMRMGQTLLATKLLWVSVMAGRSLVCRIDDRPTPCLSELPFYKPSQQAKALRLPQFICHTVIPRGKFKPPSS